MGTYVCIYTCIHTYIYVCVHIYVDVQSAQHLFMSCHVIKLDDHHFGHDAISYHFMDLDPSQHLMQPLST